MSSFFHRDFVGFFFSSILKEHIGVSFINSNNSDKSITIYYDKENNTICYGYLTRFIENNNKKGFFITRDMEEVIEELKNIAVF